jgi:hypothetical protein
MGAECLKVHFLHSHLDFFPQNLGAVSDEHFFHLFVCIMSRQWSRYPFSSLHFIVLNCAILVNLWLNFEFVMTRSYARNMYVSLSPLSFFVSSPYGPPDRYLSIPVLTLSLISPISILFPLLPVIFDRINLFLLFLHYFFCNSPFSNSLWSRFRLFFSIFPVRSYATPHQRALAAAVVA